MESQPHNPEFRINPENIQPCFKWRLLTSHLIFRVPTLPPPPPIELGGTIGGEAGITT